MLSHRGQELPALEVDAKFITWTRNMQRPNTDERGSVASGAALLHPLNSALQVLHNGGSDITVLWRPSTAWEPFGCQLNAACLQTSLQALSTR